MPGHTKCCTCHAKSSWQTWRSDAPKCNPSQEISAQTSSHLWWTCLLYCACHATCIFPVSFLHFWLGKRASRHSGVHFFAKSGPSMVCFVHFDWAMCFVLQRPALFQHLNFRKWCEPGLFCTFWLANVLRATTACNFPTSQLLKVLRSWGVPYILTSKCALRHNGVQFFISHLARWFRTRRFSEPTFRPSGATIHWKNVVFRDLPLAHLHLLSSGFRLSLLWSSFFFSSLIFSDSSHLCFSSVHIVGSLTSKLPSINLHELLDLMLMIYFFGFLIFWDYYTYTQRCMTTAPGLII